MKLSLYNAISLDGFIATKDGNSDWVDSADIPYFEAEIKKAGVIIVGKTTFEQFKGELYPVKDVVNIVMTHDKAYADENSKDNVVVTTLEPSGILSMLDLQGRKSALLVGGGKTNASFLRHNLIDEIILDIHPLVLGEGIKLFDGPFSTIQNFKLVEQKQLGHGLVLVRYTRL